MCHWSHGVQIRCVCVCACVCVCLCVRVHVCVCTCVHMCVYVRAQECLLQIFVGFIRYNISQLEDWVKGANLAKSGAIEALQPVTQATQLLQIRKKTDKDVNSIIETCTKLNTLQVS